MINKHIESNKSLKNSRIAWANHGLKGITFIVIFIDLLCSLWVAVKIQLWRKWGNLATQAKLSTSKSWLLNGRMLFRREFSSIRNLKVSRMHHISSVNQVEDILLGKQDNADIGIDRFKAINYKFSSNKLCQIDKARHIWSKMLNYTTGKQKDGNISYFILLDSVKKQVFAAIEEAKNRKLLLSHFNVFKAYMIENVL